MVKNKEDAESALSSLKDHIDMEKEIIRQSHNITEKLHGMETILEYLKNHTPKEHKKVIELNLKLEKLIDDLKKWFENELTADVVLEIEEESNYESIKKEIMHKQWRAAKKIRSEMKKEEKKLDRLHKKELEKLHNFFRKANLLFLEAKIDEKQSDNVSEYDEYEEITQYYMKHLWNFCGFYEKLFSHLMKKEEELEKS